VQLAPTTIAETSAYLAHLEARRSAVIQPDVEGRVTALLVHPGDAVAAGQPLIQIDPGSQPAAVAQARDTRRAREAEQRLAERDLHRTEALFQAGAVAREALDQARAAADAARANVEALGQQLRGSRIELGRFRVLAPMRGVVGDIPVRIGDRVTKTTALTSVTDSRTLEADVAIPVERAHELGPETQIQVLDATGAPLATGAVRFVAPRADPATQTVLVKADVPNAAGVLRADQLVPARVVWRTRIGLEIPALAVVRRAGQPFVFVMVHQNGTMVARQRPVELGATDGRTYAVRGGLRAGDWLVTSNLTQLRDGAAITPAKR